MEQFGSSLTVTLSPFGLTTLKNGTYGCLLTDGVHIIDMPMEGYRGNTELDFDEFCILLYHVDTLVSPVAIAMHGKKVWKADELLSSIPIPKQNYDDELLTEENYFPPSNVTVSDEYYRSVKDEVEESFDTLPPFEGYEETLPSAVFVRTGDVLLGKLYHGERVKYLLFGARTREELPKEHRAKAHFVPLSFFRENEGYFLLFQSGETGEIII